MEVSKRESEFMKYDNIELLGVKVSKFTYVKFLCAISDAIGNRHKIAIGYANADTLNKSYSDPVLRDILNSFDFVHPDGIGVFLASKFLYGHNGLDERITGSDFYQILLNESIRKKWKYFFFGHTDKILEDVSANNSGLIISGANEGYHFNDEDVIRKINESDANILIIGLSCPKQERWMSKNYAKINCDVILAVGEGIKVFAGKKTRGPLFMRKLGLEWVSRLITNPIKNFRKYVFGIPLFIFRILKSKSS